jgi:hypothetical protein
MAKQQLKADRYVKQIKKCLEEGYKPAHPGAQIDVYRYNSVSVRVRIIDPEFAGLSRTERDTSVWTVLDTLPDDTAQEISVLLLLTPEEKAGSLMNREFEDPTPSRL